jgi:drug/metabolite transporter (DMT)-like permease
MSRVAANAAGLGAIVSWGTLGVLGKLAEGADTRLVFASCFAIAGLIGVTICLAKGRSPTLHLSKRNVLFAGLLSAYHLVYFVSFSYAPALHVSLINEPPRFSRRLITLFHATLSNASHCS